MQNKRILLYLGHPAHYHNLKLVAKNLIKHGCQVLFVAREKDVLAKLLENSSIETVFLPARKSNSMSGLALNILRREWQMGKIVRKFKPNIMAGTDLVIAHIGRLMGIPSVLINEDDLDQVPLFAKYGVRFCNVNLAPKGCRVAGYEKKTLLYESYHELAYLHPDHFNPDAGLIEPYINTKEPFFILRFAQLTAHHDAGKTGIDNDIARQLVEKLSEHGQLYITSERPLEKEFEPYRISVPPHLMHHALALAKLYIGDSQTMAAEAAVLGTPSIRFNDFVGKLSYLEELEHRYELTLGIPTHRPEELLNTVSKWMSDPEIHQIFQQRREKLLREKVNLELLWTRFLLNYPHSHSYEGFTSA